MKLNSRHLHVVIRVMSTSTGGGKVACGVVEYPMVATRKLAMVGYLGIALFKPARGSINQYILAYRNIVGAFHSQQEKSDEPYSRPAPSAARVRRYNVICSCGNRRSEVFLYDVYMMRRIIDTPAHGSPSHSDAAIPSKYLS